MSQEAGCSKGERIHVLCGHRIHEAGLGGEEQVGVRLGGVT